MTKTWLITGTSSGFGKELATIVAKDEDANLIATARNLNDLKYLDQFDQTKIIKSVVDVTNLDEIKKLSDDIKNSFGTVDVLVNNAGIGYFSTIEESDMEQVRYMFDVNVFGLANVTNEILPMMRDQKSGVIINLSSALALTTLPTMGFYSATKYAVEGYSDTLRQEVAKLGIQVMNVEPSGARTEWSGRSSMKSIPKIADYLQFSDSVSSVSDSVHDAPGDPKLIAKVIFDQVTTKKNLPKHLPLGEFAYNGSLSNLKNMVSEIEKNQSISLSTDD
ncbi:SDR family oxidoreductase [Companilactobacillus sp.]|jgi:short-subunit dehydrogenase|uniref:SDR family oxidoreductase n=1 Tax=Companilactobacillus sp. TaxID=2767905 RepID=UPI0025B8580B|nr:SDR family oxidoreductase [Companilactobacillus sp.]MCH4008187.1 SDR family oxidoreductase [Companilactobacillus sp.]MCH4051634.1 SDR family oxidoreductase [Companilactobacillus sp.]MCH4076130.1 SDR family oxidoreductase [Companilactobacillus sp.]MCH4124705.1 SDR family oxidoreductase [Companilactobacillus sp.]MCH4131247.1 SDR family oxidoreductase [Companilactobacillus sp.]